MKKSNLLKGVVIMMLSLALVLSVTNIVFADDDDFWGNWDNASNVGGNTNTGNNTNLNTTNQNTSQGNNTNTNLSNTSQGNNTNTNLSGTNTNLTGTVNNTSNKSNVNGLVYTGIEDFSGIIAIATVVIALVSIYSYKKIKEYNNL